MVNIAKKAFFPILLLVLASAMNSAGQSAKKKTGTTAKAAVAKPVVPPKPVKETTEMMLQRIRAEYARVNADTSKMRVVREELEGHSTEGGKIIKFYSGDTLRKAILVFYGETGKTVNEYYFSNRQLFFSFERNTWYTKAITEKDSKVKKEEENRLYFDKAKLVRWADRKGKPLDKDLYEDKEKELLEVMKVIRA